MAHDAKLAADVGAWAFNVFTSVFIVFVNKALMKAYAYTFATTLVRPRRVPAPCPRKAAAT